MLLQTLVVVVWAALALAHRTMTAQEASKILSGNNRKGYLFRGDSRPETEIWKTGFKTQGQDMNLMHHLSFGGKSGFVSTTRSLQQAERYAFGRTGEKTLTGRIYVLDPAHVGTGHWIPELFPKDGPVVSNQEFAVRGDIDPKAVIGVYVIKRRPGGKTTRVWIKNEAYKGKEWRLTPGERLKWCRDAVCSVFKVEKNQGQGKKLDGMDLEEGAVAVREDMVPGEKYGVEKNKVEDVDMESNNVNNVGGNDISESVPGENDGVESNEIEGNAIRDAEGMGEERTTSKRSKYRFLNCLFT